MQIYMTFPNSYTRMIKRREIEEWCMANVGVYIELCICDSGYEREIRERILMKYAILTGNTEPKDSCRVLFGRGWRSWTVFDDVPKPDTEQPCDYTVEIDDETLAVQCKLMFC